MADSAHRLGFLSWGFTFAMAIGCGKPSVHVDEDEDEDETGDHPSPGDSLPMDPMATSTTSSMESSSTTVQPNSEECCEVHESPGCIDGEISTCVCYYLPECCSASWTIECVDMAATAYCWNTCAAVTTGDTSTGDTSTGNTSTGNTSTGDTSTGEASTGTSGNAGSSTGDTTPTNCCVAHGGTGCDDPSIEMCMCNIDDYCCNFQWDDFCVGQAERLCGLVCG